MKGKIYIAYGSNMDFPQMEGRCPDAEFLGAGMLQNWRLMFKGSKSGSYATIEKEKGLAVPVLLWRISAADELRLDRYEGFPIFYYKKTVTVADVAAVHRAGDAGAPVQNVLDRVDVIDSQPELPIPVPRELLPSEAVVLVGDEDKVQRRLQPVDGLDLFVVAVGEIADVVHVPIVPFFGLCRRFITGQSSFRRRR